MLLTETETLAGLLDRTLEGRVLFRTVVRREISTKSLSIRTWLLMSWGFGVSRLAFLWTS
jgi:hypothetical protein